jgi:hypothetical protein
MTVSSVNGSSMLTQVDNGTRMRQGPPPGPPLAGGPGGADVSKVGQSLSKLEDLATNDPEQFKKTTAAIAEKLKAAAGEATGREKEFLTSMAEKFATASDEGTTDAIQPPKPPEGSGPTQRYAQNGPSDSEVNGASEQPAGPSETMKTVWSDIFSLIDAA